MSRFANTWKLSVGFTLVLGMMISAAPSEAYRMIQNNTTGRVTSGSLVTCNNSGGFVHWTTANIPWRLNTAGQGSGKASAIQAALASWTNVSGANHNLTYAGTTSAGWSTDGINTVLWANGNGCPSGCLALTALVLQSGQRIVETDVTFNSNYTWTTNGANYDTQTVATHEFGHALGIHHTELTSTPRPTMYASYFDSGGRTLEADDRAALQCSQNRYPVGASGPAAGSELWLKSDGPVLRDLATNGVGGWIDQSGNNNHATMTTASRRPIYISSGINGKPVIRFNGAQSLNLNSPVNHQRFTIFIVGKNSKSSGFSMILGPGGSGAPNNQLRWEGTSKALFVGTGNGMPVITPSIGNNRVYHLITARYNGSTLSVYRDGNFISSHNFSTSGGWSLNQIGAWFSTYFMIGDLAEIIVYDSALSTSARTSTESYLESKYGLP